MIIYSETKDIFIGDLIAGTLDTKIQNLIKERLSRNTPESEIRSWRNSLTVMGMIIGGSGLPDDCGIAIEYNIPYTSKRVDMIVTGRTEDDRNSAVIIELKQWESAESVGGMDGIVRTYLNGSVREVTHPSYQAWSYAAAIMDYNADVQDKDVLLQPCAFLHNYIVAGQDPILGDQYRDYLVKAPVFTKQDGPKLIEFLKKFIRKGDSKETIFLIDSDRLRPSKSLQDSIASMIRGNKEFTLLDSQKVIYETISDEVRRIAGTKEKRTIIVKGGPGTGKSVLAVNLLADLTIEGMSATYVSKNAAPREVYNVKLKGTMKKTRVDGMFRSSGSFIDSPSGIFDVILADEAHRLNEKSGLFSNLGENQIKEIINAAKLSVFFIDEDQRVTLKDIGTIEEIRKQATELGSATSVLELDSQFRCSGSDGYMLWLDDVLGIRETANPSIADDMGYDFRVFDDPSELFDSIKKLNESNDKSRMVAGYCWDWIKDGVNDTSVHDIVIPGYGFEKSWNLKSTKTWAIDSGSIDEIGCIHTCQGLEFDYVGVIIGDDLRYDGKDIVTDASKRARTDQSLRGLRSYSKEDARNIADRIIKNTYKVLMTRGLKGCYVYCTDKRLAEYLKERALKPTG